MSNSIFVFGSNTEGRHGKGAALHARLHHGAIYGQPRGLQGNSYAVVTKELRPSFPRVTIHEIRVQLQELFHFALQHPDYTFLVSPIGTGLAGYTQYEIAPLFLPVWSNRQFQLPEVWQSILAQYEEDMGDGAFD